MALKILLADDSMTAQNMGRKILTEAGFEVVPVSHGAAALKKLAEQKPDLLILDIYMPGYTGLEVCERVKNAAETALLPVLLTVGKMEPFRPEDANRVKADGIIIKPFEATDLISAVQKIEAKIKAEMEDTVTLQAPIIPPREFQDPSYQEWKQAAEDTAAEEPAAHAHFEVAPEFGAAPAMMEDLPAPSPAAPVFEVPPAPEPAPEKEFNIPAAASFTEAASPLFDVFTPSQSADEVAAHGAAESANFAVVPGFAPSVIEQVEQATASFVPEPLPAAREPVSEVEDSSSAITAFEISVPDVSVSDGQPPAEEPQAFDPMALAPETVEDQAAQELSVELPSEPAADQAAAVVISPPVLDDVEPRADAPPAYMAIEHEAEVIAAPRVEVSIETAPELETTIAPPVEVTGVEAVAEFEPTLLQSAPAPDVVVETGLVTDATEMATAFPTTFGLVDAEPLPVGIATESPVPLDAVSDKEAPLEAPAPAEPAPMQDDEFEARVAAALAALETPPPAAVTEPQPVVEVPEIEVELVEEPGAASATTLVKAAEPESLAPAEQISSEAAEEFAAPIIERVAASACGAAAAVAPALEKPEHAHAIVDKTAIEQLVNRVVERLKPALIAEITRELDTEKDE